MADLGPIILKDNYYINQGVEDYKDIILGDPGDDDKKVTVKKAGCYICSIATIVAWKLEATTTSAKKAILTKLAENCKKDGSYKGGTVTYDGHDITISNISDMHQSIIDEEPCICEIPGHFVVINGMDYTGSTTYEQYLVLDPGRIKNNNLQEVMDCFLSDDESDKINSKRKVTVS